MPCACRPDRCQANLHSLQRCPTCTYMLRGHQLRLSDTLHSAVPPSALLHKSAKHCDHLFADAHVRALRRACLRDPKPVTPCTHKTCEREIDDTECKRERWVVAGSHQQRVQGQPLCPTAADHFVGAARQHADLQHGHSTARTPGQCTLLALQPPRNQALGATFYAPNEMQHASCTQAPHYLNSHCRRLTISCRVVARLMGGAHSKPGRREQLKIHACEGWRVASTDTVHTSAEKPCTQRAHLLGPTKCVGKGVSRCNGTLDLRRLTSVGSR